EPYEQCLGSTGKERRRDKSAQEEARVRDEHVKILSSWVAIASLPLKRDQTPATMREISSL
ncbi:MAG: hypothetical protein RL258_781, partial [Pseudomonadota bacterium]